MSTTTIGSPLLILGAPVAPVAPVAPGVEFEEFLKIYKELKEHQELKEKTHDENNELKEKTDEEQLHEDRTNVRYSRLWDEAESYETGEPHPEVKEIKEKIEAEIKEEIEEEIKEEIDEEKARNASTKLRTQESGIRANFVHKLK